MAFILFVSSVRKISNQIRRINNIVRCIRHFRLALQALKCMKCHCRWKYRRPRARSKTRNVSKLSEIFNWPVASTARKNSNLNRRSNKILWLRIKHFRQTKKAIQCSYLWRGKYRWQGWARKKTSSNQIRRFNNIVRCIRHFRQAQQALRCMSYLKRPKARIQTSWRRKTRSVGQLS